MYRMVDTMDTPGFVNLFTDNGIFRWANMPASIRQTKHYSISERIFSIDQSDQSYRP